MTTYIRFTKDTEIESLEKLRNSRNGNPRFKIRFTNGIEGTTQTDAGWAYAIHSGMRKVRVRFHYTNSGRCIIDKLSEA